jgi:hypothetical protein
MQDSFFFEFADEQVLAQGLWPAFLEPCSLQLRNDIYKKPDTGSFFIFFFYKDLVILPITGNFTIPVLLRYQYFYQIPVRLLDTLGNG